MVEKTDQATYHQLTAVEDQVAITCFQKTVAAHPDDPDVDTFVPIDEETLAAVLAMVRSPATPAYNEYTNRMETFALHNQK